MTNETNSDEHKNRTDRCIAPDCEAGATFHDALADGLRLCDEHQSYVSQEAQEKYRL